MNSLPWRVESVESSTTFFGYLGTETLHEPSGSTDTYCVYAAGFRVAGWFQARLSAIYIQTVSAAPAWSDSKKTVVFSVSWSFGLDSTATGSESHGFTGKPYSEPIGLYYYHHGRTTGKQCQFITPDLGSLG